MTPQQSKKLIWILGGLCALNLILAFNAGGKRKNAVSDLDTLQAKIDELDLCYKNAIHSYDNIEKKLKEAEGDLQEQLLFNESIKEVLMQEQLKSLALREELEKIKAATKKQASQRRPSSNIAH